MNPAPTTHESPDSHFSPRTVLDASDISRALTRIAHEILERNRGADPVVLLGIPTRGVGLAARIRDRIAAVEGRSVPTGSLDVTMYRDDIGLKPARALEHTDIPPGGIDGKVVVLVDDVLFSGRTIRAALDAIGDIGRPKAVQLAVLVDRGHRELPIRADYVGKNLPTSLVERVTVHLSEYDEADAVVIADKPAPERRPAGEGPTASGGRSAGEGRGAPASGEASAGVAPSDKESGSEQGKAEQEVQAR